MARRVGPGRFAPPATICVLTVLALTALVMTALALPVAAAGGDPYRPQQWGLERVGAPTAWATSQGTGQVVAIVDTGVDLLHPDLIDRFFRDANGDVVGFDFVDDDADPTDRHGHGTMVAGVVAASVDNGIGIASVAPQARIMPVRVLDESASGSATAVDDGIRWAVDHGATIINLSLESAAALPGQVLGVSAPTAAVRYAWDNGVVVVAAAGNSGSSFTDYPSSSPVVLVGATNRDDERWEQSDAGRDDLLMAPGVDIVSTWCRANGSTTCDGQTHNIGEADGTSFAAPHVAGAVALLRASGRTPQQSIDRLRATARDIGASGRDDETGYGLIDVAAAVGSGPAPTPTPSSTSPSPRPSASPSASPSGKPSASASPAATETGTGGPSSAPSATDGPSGPTSPSPSASPSNASPSELSTPSDTPSDPLPTPSPSRAGTDPVALDPDGSDPQRGLLHVVATLLVIFTAVASGRGFIRRA